MKKIKIAHLYYDLMNLYGENGNIRYLKRKLEEQEIDVTVHFLSMEDEIDYDKYDIYYIGTGSEENKIIVLKDMLKDKDSILKAIKDNKYFLVTGNALDMFGKVINREDDKIEALGAFDYEVNEEEFRIVGEQLYSSNVIKEKIVGFQNRNSVLVNNSDNTLFDVIKGTGNKPNDSNEGIHENNFFGTYLLGPILVRNPYFTDYIIKKICKDMGVKYKKLNQDVSYIAYKEYIKNFYENQ